MSLLVDIEKDYGGFHLCSRFETNGGITGLLGASGCGKSQTLRCIAGVQTPDQGRIVLDGVTLYDSEQHINLTPQQRGVGYLFQSYALFPNMTVLENILMGFNENESELKKRLAGCMKELNFDLNLQRKANTLSIAEQQLVELLVRALDDGDMHVRVVLVKAADDLGQPVRRDAEIAADHDIADDLAADGGRDLPQLLVPLDDLAQDGHDALAVRRVAALQNGE